MEAVLQAGFPVAVLLAFFAAVGDLEDAAALAGDADRLDDQARNAEVVEVEGVGEQLRLIRLGGALVDLEEELGRLIDEAVGAGVCAQADEHFGGLLGALAEVGASELAG